MSTIPKSFSTLTYPFDLGPEYFTPDCIVFEFFKRTGVSLANVAEGASDAWSNVQDAYETYVDIRDDSDWAKALAMDDADFRKRSGGASAKELYDKALANMRAETIKYNGVFSENKMEAMTNGAKAFYSGGAMARDNFKTENSKLIPIGNIYLNMPNGFATSEEATWGGQELGLTGTAVKSLFQNNQNTQGGLTGAAVGGIGNLMGVGLGATAGTLMGKMGLGAVVGGLLGGGSIQKGLEAGLRMAQNPYMEMMFSGIGFRSFKFDFIFHPHSKDEIVTVSNIIKMFRQHSRPTWSDGPLGKSFMDYPLEYGIEFMTDKNGSWETNQHLPKLKHCVCSSVETNFTPNGVWSAYKAGAPVAITLGLSFSETELIMADDIEENDWPHTDEPSGNQNTNSNRSIPQSSTVVVPR